MTLTRTPCSLVEPACVDALRNSFAFTFDDDAARDTFFSANTTLLENDGTKNTLAFIGTTSLRYAYWNGANTPTSYDNTKWVELPVVTTPTGDIHYWGDPSTDSTMRARRDPATGFLYFERRVGGAWESKFSVTNSATVDTLKLTEATGGPVIMQGELGLYNVKLLDADHGNKEILRPIFTDADGNHYPVVAGAPDGSLRVPQNIEAALLDPSGTPVTYKKVLLEDDTDKIKALLQGKFSYNDLTDKPTIPAEVTWAKVVQTSEEDATGKKLDASYVKNLPAQTPMTGTEIIHAIETDPADPKLDASHIENLPAPAAMTGTEIIQAIVNDPADPKLPAEEVDNLAKTDYAESDGQHQFDPINLTYMEILFEHTGAADQTMPNIINCRDMMFLMLRNVKTDGSPVTLLPANQGQQVNGTPSYTLDVGVSALFVCMKGRSDWRLLLEQDENDAPVTSGITLANDTADVAGLTKINVPTSTIVAKGGGEADLIPHITLRNMPPGQEDNLAKEVHLQPPLKTFADPDTQEVGQIYIDPGAYEPQHAPGMLVQLSSNVGVVGTMPGTEKEHDGVIFCDVFITPAGEYFDVRRPQKAYGIQDAAQEDPNITGGMPTEVMANVGFIGDAPMDGKVRCYWRVKNLLSDVENYLTDPNGNPIIIERNYKMGDKLRDELVAGVVEAKGVEYVRLHVMHTFGTEVVLINHNHTYICLQQKMHGYQTSVAKLAFEQRVGAQLHPRIEYMGPDEVVLRTYLGTDQPTGEFDPGAAFDELGQFGIHQLTKVSAGVASDVLTISSASDGSTTDFNVHQIEDFETIQMARGHNVKYEIKIEDKDTGWRLDLYAWTGSPNEFTPLYNSRNNGSLIVTTGWTRIATTFISEDVISGTHTASVSGTIPDNANNFGAFIYPVQEQNPLTLKLSDFTLSYDPAFTGFLESSPELDAEQHLVFDPKYKEFVQNTQGYAGLRYTLNNVAAGLPMPAGVPGKGTADITLDTSINQVPGSSARGGEGALKFGVDGDVKVSTTLNLWNEQGTDNTATFWWANVSPDGNTFTKIPDSEKSFPVKANTNTHGSLFDMPTFTYHATVGSRIVLRGKANKADGAFLDCVSDKIPMVQTVCKFDELVPALTTDPSIRFTKAELRVIEFTGITAQNYTFEFKLPDGVEIGSHAVVHKAPDGKIISEVDSEFSYDPATEEMTVHIGTVKDGKIYMTLWSA